MCTAMPTLVQTHIFTFLSCSVSDYVQMDVFTSAKSAQYVEILGQG